MYSIALNCSLRVNAHKQQQKPSQCVRLFALAFSLSLPLIGYMFAVYTGIRHIYIYKNHRRYLLMHK